MRIKNQIFIIIALSIIVFSCGGGEDSPGEITPPTNTKPSAVSLIYPSENLLCIDNTIAFNWTQATDPDNDQVRYKITISKSRDLTNPIENRTVSGTLLNISLEKAIAYYWRIISVDSKGNEGDPSPILAFYTSGEGVSNYAPFTAELVSPQGDSNIDAGTVTLNWKGADTNESDTLTYELFFGESTDPALVSSELSAEITDVIVEAGKTYYWKVNTSDDAGAKSIGQIWSFNVN
ncbi:hypothetical protein [uncultured Algibacter sp.]|uniref:hypothetical protein n=1 Tax=uncultured Algibacter sp. TaxID=298659 RepID=UPI00263151DA|nr:hypothetical protein [uncultured Algibacter sp.]